MEPVEAAQVAAPAAAKATVHVQRLTWVLAWAIVFCDIGTSIYYVPGILYEQVGVEAPLFVAMVTLGFIPLALKYVEISWRNPEGGGVVTVAGKAFRPALGRVRGVLITSSYFLTSSISTTSAFCYVGSLVPIFEEYVVAFSCLGIALLAGLNVIGIRESATVSLWMAVAALAVDAWVIGAVIVAIGFEEAVALIDRARTIEGLTTERALVGFSGAWLAFSGLESIAQLSPTMAQPLQKNIRKTMYAVIATVLLTAPLLTLFSIGLLDPRAWRASVSSRSSARSWAARRRGSPSWRRPRRFCSSRRTRRSSAATTCSWRSRSRGSCRARSWFGIAPTARRTWRSRSPRSCRSSW